MKRVRLLTLLFSFSLVFVFSWYCLNGHPSDWSLVKTGMSIERVHELCGSPDRSSWQNKGDFWVRDNLFGSWEFMVANSADKAGETRIRLLVGEKDPIAVIIKKNGKLYIRL